MTKDKTPTKSQQAQQYAEKNALHVLHGNVQGRVADLQGMLAQAYSDGYTAAEQSMWRSVEEELPEDGETVLLSINGSRLTGYYSHDDELWEVDGIGAYERNDVSHWCKLPSLPDTNTEKK